MSISLSIEQKSVFALLSDKNSCFLIPDYQRPYAWDENECATLWNDIQDKKSLTVKRRIEQCLWKTDEFGEPDTSVLKIESETATDNDKGEFRNILLTGYAPYNFKSRYAENFRFFQEKISDFKDKTPDYFSFLPIRILGNCILLPIKTESQDTALRIFSTLNDRGMPLSDSDIFKAQLYKAFSDEGKREEFIADWKELENLCGKIFQLADNPMDEIFTRYMYFERAKRDVRGSTLEGLRKFYEADNYELLKKYHHRLRLNTFTRATDYQSQKISRQLGTSHCLRRKSISAPLTTNFRTKQNIISDKSKTNPQRIFMSFKHSHKQ